MAKYLILDGDGVAVNCIEWDGKAKWSPPDGCVAKPVDANLPFNHGWKWDGKQLVNPNPPAAEAKAEKGMTIA